MFLGERRLDCLNPFSSGKKDGLKAIICLASLSVLFFSYSLWISNDTLWGISFPCVLLATRLGTKGTEAAGRAWPVYEYDGNSLPRVSFRETVLYYKAKGRYRMGTAAGLSPNLCLASPSYYASRWESCCKWTPPHYPSSESYRDMWTVTFSGMVFQKYYVTISKLPHRFLTFPCFSAFSLDWCLIRCQFIGYDFDHLHYTIAQYSVSNILDPLICIWSFKNSFIVSYLLFLVNSAEFSK